MTTSAMIEGVVIVNRKGCGNRLGNSLVEVLDDNGIVVADETIGSTINGEVITLQFNGVVGKTVKINQGGQGGEPDCSSGKYVQVPEVRVYVSAPTSAPTSGPTSALTSAPTSGPTSAPISAPTSAPEFPFENIARNGVASQSCDFDDSNYQPNSAIDANINTYSLTCEDPEAWWKVDMNTSASIGTVVITNNRIGTATNGEVITLEFNGVVGKTVKINQGGQRADDPICMPGLFVLVLEVEVYGMPIYDNLARDGVASQSCDWGDG